MIKVVRRIGIIIGIVFILSQPQVLNELFALLFVGIVPMTNIALPFWIMAPLLGILCVICLNWLIRQDVMIGYTPNQEKIAKSRARRHVLRETTKQKKIITKPTTRQRTRKRYQTVSS